MKLNTLTIIPAVLAAGLIAAYGEVTVTKSVAMPAQLQGVVNTTDCDNSGGPWVTLEGQLALGGLKVNLIFQNNVKGTHTAVVYTTNITVLDLGASIVLPKQPVRGGVGGNPHIWLQLLNGSNEPLTDELYLGRCVQGLTVTPDIIEQIVANSTISSGDCKNSGGPWITLGGELTLSGVNARFIFRNNADGTHEASAIRDITLVINGSKIVIPKQPVRGGAGGNPLIYIQFLQGDGTPIGDPQFLGRCNQI